MVDDKKLRELGEKPVLSLLMQYAVPAIVAMVASSLYNIIDGVFIRAGRRSGRNYGVGPYVACYEYFGRFRRDGRCWRKHPDVGKAGRKRL